MLVSHRELSHFLTTNTTSSDSNSTRGILWSFKDAFLDKSFLSKCLVAEVLPLILIFLTLFFQLLLTLDFLGLPFL